MKGKSHERKAGNFKESATHITLVSSFSCIYALILDWSWKIFLTGGCFTTLPKLSPHTTHYKISNSHAMLYTLCMHLQSAYLGVLFRSRAKRTKRKRARFFLVCCFLHFRFSFIGESIYSTPLIYYNKPPRSPIFLFFQKGKVKVARGLGNKFFARLKNI